MQYVTREVIKSNDKIFDEGTWITHLNDIRYLTSNISNYRYSRKLMNELKLLLIFYNHKIIISDSDINNNVLFQEMFLSNIYNIQTLFAKGLIVPAIRNNANSFYDQNEQQGIRRAVPESYDKAKIFSSKFDDYLVNNAISCIEWQINIGADSFQKTLSSFYTNVLSPLNEEEKVKLEIECNKAIEANKKNILLFGDLYNKLVREENISPNSRIIQSIRAVHTTNLACRLGFCPSVPIDDIDIELFQYSVKQKKYEEIKIEDSAEIYNTLPNKILTQNDLNNLSFDRIEEIQKIGNDIGYFEALVSLKKCYYIRGCTR